MVGLLFVGYGTTVQGQIQDFAVVDTTPLMRFGPTSPINGYPMWVQDANGLVLELCEDTNDVTPPTVIDPETGAIFPPCPACVDPALDLPNANLPQSFPDNYPDEHFYWLSESIMIETDNSRSIVTMALEGAFDGLGAVVDGEQIVFTRYRVRVDNANPGDLYQITYPYGVTYVEAELDQAGAAISNINFTNDIFLWKGVSLRTPLDSIMGTFLTSVTPPPAAGVIPTDPITGLPTGDPANTQTYLQDFCGAGVVQGSPFGTNFFSVVGPDAGIVQSTVHTTRDPSLSQCDPLDPAMVAAFDAYDAYVVANLDPAFLGLARIPDNCTFSDEFTGITKPATKLGVQIDRATYNRDLTAGNNSTQINVWANSFQGQDIQLTVPGIVGDIQMCGDGTGNYFAHVLMPSSFIPPTEVTVTNFTDDPPTVATHALAANIQIQSAVANLGTGFLDITATVADPAQAGGSLSTGGSLFTQDPTIATAGTASIALGAGACGAVPPLSVSVASGQGGLVTAPTQVLGVVPDLLAAAGGPQTVALGSLVTLDGSASVHGAGTTFLWTQVGGTGVVLSDPAAVSPTFTFPATTDLLTFTLTITDVFGITSTDNATVTNTVFAVAGLDQDLALFPDAGVALDASQSQGAGLSYSWAQIPVDTAVSTQCVGVTLDAAASVAIDPVNTALATLTMPLEGGCVTLELTASGPGGSATDTITIKAPVGAPVADAGTDIVVFANEVVQLDAGASAGIINTDGTGFTWLQIGTGDAVQLGTLQPDNTILIDPLGPPHIPNPAFVFPATPQTLTFQVTVLGPGGSSTASVNVIVDNPGTADTLIPNRARYVENKERFTVSGNSSIPGPGHSVTCWLGSPTTGDLIGTSAVDAVAGWKVDTFGGINPCLTDPGIVDPTNCKNVPIADHLLQVHCVSTLGGTLIMDWEAK